MRAKNALKIAVGNYALVFKNLLYKIIVFTIFSFVIGLLLKIRLKPVFDLLRPVFADLANIVIAILKDTDYPTVSAALKADFGAVISYLSNNVGSMVATAFILTGIFFIYRFVTGISDCTLMILVNEHMTELSHRGYIVTLVENLKKILLYQLIDAVSIIVYTALVALISWGVFTLMFMILPIASLFATAFIIVIASALYCTVFSQVMANILIGENKNFKQSLLKGLTPKREYFGKMFAVYISVIIILIYLNVTVTIFTFGVGELILIPFASLLLVTLKTVDYFTINKKKYFIDFDNIFIPKELRENDEQLLSDVEI